MLDTLLETKPVRTKRMGGTVMSTLVHLAIATGAIAITRPQPRVAIAGPVEPPTIYIAIPTRPELTREPQHGPTTSHTDRLTPMPVIPYVDPKLPVIAGPVIDERPMTTDGDYDFGPKHGTSAIGGDDVGGLVGPTDGVFDEHLVERAPRIVGHAPEPEFPSSLRQSGTNGRVVVQFAVDTLGRAEMSGLKMIEESDARFGDAVRAVLPKYRFSPGEVRGRKVRTLVQIPFDFTLVR